jgi:hypothetical protein
MMATEDVIDWILQMDEEALATFPKDIDPLTIYRDTRFFDMLKENQNIPDHLVDGLKAYL